MTKGDSHCPTASAPPANAAIPSVQSLGRGVYLFRWPRGFYQSMFIVGRRGVLPMDPINVDAAPAYRRAISDVTNLPVTRLLYSRDHRDHIVGGAAMGSDLEVLAHKSARARIATRCDADILPPTRTVCHGEALRVGEQHLELQYFGPNHSDSNVLAPVPTGEGRILVWVDGVEPGVAPYGNLPDTAFGGYLLALEQASRLDFDLTVGGHLGPAPRHWVSDYREYLLSLLDATDKMFQQSGGQMPLPGEDGVAMTERVRQEVTARAAARLRARFGHWSGFEQWAPQTADRVLSYLITGN